MPCRATGLAKHIPKHQLDRLTDGEQMQTIFARKQFDEAVLVGGQVGVSVFGWPGRVDGAGADVAIPSNTAAFEAPILRAASRPDCLLAHTAAKEFPPRTKRRKVLAGPNTVRLATVRPEVSKGLCA